ncbi:MAG: oxidoreductase [Rickettsiales bacterium]|nr:oxidoreductase [Rickettsiales bacterium]|tara:strand:- start:2203 stop:3150 length:948 start_codon:yes stop_codon:yes gene_type:complete
MSKKFAIIGASGFVAPRHMKAIHDTGNKLLAAYDPFDSIGILDKFFPKTHFFVELERFDRYLDKLRIQNKKINFISICSPNYLHDSHIRFSLRSGSHVICEKPIVINPWNLDSILKMSQENKKNVFTILQLRYLSNVIKLKNNEENSKQISDIDLTYITGRGNWYYNSWKGDESKSGGILLNIGIHFFDLLCWIYGKVESTKIHIRKRDFAAGIINFKNARVRWFLSLNFDHLPTKVKNKQNTFKELIINGKKIDLNKGFEDLHTISYEKILCNEGYQINDTEDSIRTVYELRHKKISPLIEEYHPLAKKFINEK